ncbi:MAG: MSHA biogenesis protein MshI [Alphaproteobacteria bacterium]|jgi:MSHA biogenesis protein MshI
MRIGWKQFIKQKLRNSSAYHAVGIAFTADQVLLCALHKKDDQYTWALDASFSHENWQESLPIYVKKEGLAGAPCFFALSSHWYRIHQVDKPQVNDEELFEALQWPIKEMSGSEKEIVYDYSDMPVQVSGQNKVMAVAVAKEKVEKLTKAIYLANLDLKSIVVEELATTHLVPVSNEPVITLVQEHGEVVVLNIIKNNQLYFTRRLKGFENIGGFSEIELDMGITESICVQIQRSMDFFESQLRQAPIKRILLKLDSPHISFLSTRIAESMGVACEAFEPDIICAEGFNFKMASFSCLGAAYTGALTILEPALLNQKSSKESKAKNATETEEAVHEVAN